MKIKQKTIDFGKKYLKKIFIILNKNNQLLIKSELAGKLSPILYQQTNSGKIKFYCPGKTALYRARTLLTKEPETIEWIEGLNDTDTIWDIGANVGVYTLYAALRGLNVVAFEPSPSNYYILSRNIEINGFDQKVFALCIAFNDSTELDFFYMASTELGGALNSFGEPVDWQGNRLNVKMKQAMLGFTIDDFIKQFKPLFPNHIKIDVDGNENKIITGALKTLKDKRLKSLCIELNIDKENHKKLIEIFGDNSFQVKKRAKRANGCELYNYIFTRQ